MPLSMPLELSQYIQDFARPVTHPMWGEGSFSGEAIRSSEVFVEFERDLDSILSMRVPWYIDGINPSHSEVTWAQWYFVRKTLTIMDMDMYDIVIYGYDINYSVQEIIYY